MPCVGAGGYGSDQLVIKQPDDAFDQFTIGKLNTEWFDWIYVHRATKRNFQRQHWHERPERHDWNLGQQRADWQHRHE